MGTGAYRTAPGQAGKYFFPTEAQAQNFAQLMSKSPKGNGPYCITSGCIDSARLSAVERLSIGGEVQAWFIPKELLPYVRNVVNHGPAG